MTDHWRIYTPIDDVTTFGAAGDGPVTRRLNITANAHLSQLYPERRIALGVVGIGLVSLTPEQSADLRVQLERAERDIGAAAAPLTATGTEGRCESCSAEVRGGEPIVVEDEGTEDRVVLHAGKCPAAQGRN
jgi:hypothetical protein